MPGYAIADDQPGIVPAPAGPDLDWTGFHTFRHMCVSVLLDSGTNVRQFAAWLGREDPAFEIRTYAHLTGRRVGCCGVVRDLDHGISNQEVGR